MTKKSPKLGTGKHQSQFNKTGKRKTITSGQKERIDMDLSVMSNATNITVLNDQETHLKEEQKIVVQNFAVEEAPELEPENLIPATGEAVAEKEEEKSPAPGEQPEAEQLEQINEEPEGSMVEKEEAKPLEEKPVEVAMIDQKNDVVAAPPKEPSERGSSAEQPVPEVETFEEGLLPIRESDQSEGGPTNQKQPEERAEQVSPAEPEQPDEPKEEEVPVSQPPTEPVVVPEVVTPPLEPEALTPQAEKPEGEQPPAEKTKPKQPATAEAEETGPSKVEVMEVETAPEAKKHVKHQSYRPDPYQGSLAPLIEPKTESKPPTQRESVEPISFVGGS